MMNLDLFKKIFVVSACYVLTTTICLAGEPSEYEDEDEGQPYQQQPQYPPQQQQYGSPQYAPAPQYNQGGYSQNGGYSQQGLACNPEENPHSFACHHAAYLGKTQFPLVPINWMSPAMQGEWSVLTYANQQTNADSWFQMNLDPNRPTRPQGGVLTVVGDQLQEMGSFWVRGDQGTFSNWLGAPMASVPGSLHAIDQITVQFMSQDSHGGTHMFQCRVFIRNNNQHLNCQWYIPGEQGQQWELAGYFGMLKKSSWNQIMGGQYVVQGIESPGVYLEEDYVNGTYIPFLPQPYFLPLAPIFVPYRGYMPFQTLVRPQMFFHQRRFFVPQVFAHRQDFRFQQNHNRGGGFRNGFPAQTVPGGIQPRHMNQGGWMGMQGRPPANGGIAVPPQNGGGFRGGMQSRQQIPGGVIQQPRINGGVQGFPQQGRPVNNGIVMAPANGGFRGAPPQQQIHVNVQPPMAQQPRFNNAPIAAPRMAAPPAGAAMGGGFRGGGFGGRQR